MSYEREYLEIVEIEGEQYLAQRGDFISMVRPVTELLECERDEVQNMDYYLESA